MAYTFLHWTGKELSGSSSLPCRVSRCQHEWNGVLAVNLVFALGYSRGPLSLQLSDFLCLFCISRCRSPPPSPSPSLFLPLSRSLSRSPSLSLSLARSLSLFVSLSGALSVSICICYCLCVEVTAYMICRVNWQMFSCNLVGKGRGTECVSLLIHRVLISMAKTLLEHLTVAWWDSSRARNGLE